MDLLSLTWRLQKRGGTEACCTAIPTSDGLAIHNDTPENVELWASRPVFARSANPNGVTITFRSTAPTDTAATLLVNESSVPLNSVSSIPVATPAAFSFGLRVASLSKVLISEMRCDIEEKPRDLLLELGEGADVLVVAPTYPSSESLYHCGFVHARVREYLARGLKVHVAVVAQAYALETLYQIDGVKVIRGDHAMLKRLINRRTYKAVVVHFVDELLMQLFDACIRDEQLIFICHGPETLFEYLPNVTRPYFTKEVELTDEMHQSFALKRRCIERYRNKANVTWVFVSEWLKSYSEELLGFQFPRSCVIHNLINERLFPYREKTAEHRKKILILRKFDNICQHSLDQCALAVQELSRRPYFDDLTISVYGDGDFFDPLVEPLRRFKNVRIRRGFLTHDQIREVHAEHGIALLPSRHDAHAVAMGEAASSGLVVVGSEVTSNGDFMNSKVNRTLAHPERPDELANILERLYLEPDEFLQISRRLSEATRSRCGSDQTAGKEVELIERARRTEPRLNPSGARTAEPTVLSVIVPAYNIEGFIEKCLASLLDHQLTPHLEVLVVNDGSTDSTLERARRFEASYPGIVRVIDQPNGGHGSTINTGIREAKGAFTRVVDGDDWVDSRLLAEQIRRLKSETADLVLTETSYEDADAAQLRTGIRYDTLNDGAVYHFEDLALPFYDFLREGYTLPSSTIRTERLRGAGFRLTQRCAYVDQEWNAYTLNAIERVAYYRLDIYRYFIGREGQTVSRSTWAKKHADHRRVVFNVIHFLETEKRLSAFKERYLVTRILAPVVDSQVFMYDQTRRWDLLATFVEALREHPAAHDASMEYIKNRPGRESWTILKKYQKRLALRPDELKHAPPIIGPTARRPQFKELSLATATRMLSSGTWTKSVLPPVVYESFQRELKGNERRLLRHMARCFVPTGLVAVYKRRRRLGARFTGVELAPPRR